MTKNLLQKSTMLFGILLLSAQLNVSAQQNVRLIDDYLKLEQQKNGWLQNDVKDWYQSDYYTDETSGLTYAYVQQRHHHIIVYNAISIFLVKDNKVLHFTPGIIDHLERKVKTSVPSITAKEAIGYALTHLGRTQPAEVKLTGSDTDLNKFIFDSPGISASPVKVQLVYRATDEGVFLAWDVSIEMKDEPHWWNIRINALNGDYLDKNDWTTNCSFEDSPHNYIIHDQESFIPNSPPPPLPPAPVPAEYQVFPFPIEAPSFGSRSILFNPSDNTASPHGWHDVNGATGAEYTITRGNNVHAYEDANNDNQPGYSPNSATLQFNYPLDLTQAPLVNQDASITNLFYLNNRIHDVLYHAGFTEAAGNFQQNNYGNGGLGNDYVKAEAFDGSGTNNANFSTPVDGSSGRMQMYLWTAPTPDRDGSFDNGIVSHEYGHGLSNRLTGGPANSSCLNNAEQGGEGWSDWLALIMTTEPGDTTGGGILTQARGIGTYALNQATSGLGIRRYRYSVNMAINPQTYADLAASSGPHAKGEIWCDAIWDMSCFLIKDLGFNSNPTVTTSGNYIAMRLVLEGMKLQPCSPGYLDARDAILAADAALYNNAHRCRIWEAFARRGMGYNAVQGSSNSSTDQTAGFSMPPVCLTATQPPVAAFTSNFSTVTCMGNVSFTDQSVQPFSWLWNFGDNTTSTLQNPVHAYNAPGTYNVKLVVTNTLGSDSTIHIVTVTPSYSATVTATPSAVCSGSTVQLNAAGTGSPNITYNVSNITYAPVAGTGTTVTLADDAMSTVKPIGFTFNFFGQNYTNFYICSNGFITFSAGQPASPVYGVPIPTSAAPNNYIALAWNDLYPPAAGSSVSYFNTGVSPNQKLIVKYSTWHFLGGTTYPFIVQAILSEGSNQVEIHTTTISNVSAADASATTTQGVENISGTAGVAVPGRNSAHFTANNDAYRFTPVVNYTYTWQPGNLNGAIQTVTPASTGTYTVNIGDGSGCIIPFTSPVITVNPNPVPAITGNSAICAGSSTTLNAGTFSGYSWSTGATTQTISVSTAGTFTVTVTNASGCTGSASRTMTVNPAPTPSISGTLSFCSGSSTTLNAGVFTSYNWSTGATTQTISANTAGTFTVIVTNAGGCTGSASATTTVNTNPAPSISGTLSFCSGSSTTLNAGAFTSYNWSTGATTQTISANTAGTFTVTVTNAGGCTGSASATTTVNTNPAPSITGSLSFCSGSSTTLNAGVFTSYSWSTGATTQTISANTAGTFTVTVTNATGCTGSASATTTVNANPTPSVSGTLSFCSGSSTTLNAGVFTSYNWSTGATTQTISVNTANTFTVTVTNSSGCTGSASATTTVTTALTPTISGNLSFCSGSSTILNLGAGYSSYSWSTGATTQTISVNTAGSWAGTVTLNGCSGTSPSVNTTVTPAPTATISGNSTICLTQAATLNLTFTGTGPWNYTISDGSQTVSGSSSASTAILNITPSTAGSHNYSITVLSDANCSGTGSGTAVVIVSSAPPSNTFITSVTGPTAGACDGDVYLVTANSTITPGTTYQWSTGGNSPVVLFSNLQTGPFVAGPFATTGKTVWAQFGALITGTYYYVCAKAVNGCGISATYKCQTVRGIVGVPGTITPANPVACPNDVKNYSCGASAGAAIYSWTLGGSATPVTSGQGTQNVQVTFPPAFVSGQLCVTASLSCGGSSTSAPRCVTLTNNPALPASMTGPSKVCPGATGVVFSVPLVTGATGYNWTVPAGCTIVSGQNSTSISVDFPNSYTGAPPVCVTALSECGASVARCKTVGSNIPGQPGSITGPTTNICNSTVQYSISNVANATGYSWTIPSGTTITSGQGTTTILLNVSPVFTSGFLTVTATTNLCTPGTSPPRSITISGKPNTPAAITANPLTWCSGAFVNFSTPAATPLPVYNWIVTNSTIQAGQGSNNIDVQWGTGTGNVKVSATNGCGVSGVRSQNFSSVCREEGEELSVISNRFSVYPNPAHDYITVSIDVKEASAFALQLIDITGRIVLSEDQIFNKGLNNYEMKLNQLAKGIYILDVRSGNESRKTKVVVE
ncbi:MAG TPA: M36 family metallopeptidase [Bacteroidia bacterium]|nr:M36 family metallopeptidase [Bacteroidia bacterium]